MKEAVIAMLVFSIILIGGCGKETKLQADNNTVEVLEITKFMNSPLATGNDKAVVEMNDFLFETISQEFNSKHGERAAYAITNDSEWKKLQRKVRVAALPEIDFDKEMTIAVFQGTFGSGHGIEIVRLVETEDSLQVFIKENNETNAMPVETRPYHIIKTARSEKKIIFPEGNFISVKNQYHEPLRTLKAGETATYSIDTFDYEIKAIIINETPLKVEFSLNGDVFDLEKGETYETRSGIRLKVHNITDRLVEFELQP